MANSLAVVPLALIFAIFGVACVALLPRSILLVLLIILRSVADIGSFSATGSLLPGSSISAVVALVVICALVIPAPSRLSPRVCGCAVLVMAILSSWTFITIYTFGIEYEFLGEYLRSASFVATLILAYRVGMDSGAKAMFWTNLAVGIPAVILIVGYMVGWSATLIEGGRATGTFSHPNSAGAFFAVGVIACIWGYSKSRRRLSLVVALTGLIALLLTQSLGAIFALGVGAVVLYALNARMALGRRIALILAGLGIVLSLFYLMGVSGRLTEFQGFDYGAAAGDNSLDWRFANWQLLMPVWWDGSPLIGFGWGSTRYEIQPLGTFPHNIFVQLLVELGIVGLSLGVLLVVAFLRAVRRRYRTDPETASALAAIVAIIAVHGLVANWLNYSAAQYLAVFAVGVMLGQSSSHRAVGAPPVEPSDRPPKGLVIRAGR